ncbi:hypothetical protein BSL78_01176 [Apostichopus japonicus]|uniref:Uncharacterized protein n=1 Tax=Stichopus japonicus TaxID=307972 RepID=A0A2G8LNN7_STIJA|nr:hypothetical protein BSL78_01176 [Apostichopus japonicus]
MEKTRGKYASHTELMKALGKAGLDNLAKDVDQMGSVSVVKGAMSDFCIRYVSSWIHTSRAHEWPSLVQNIPSDLVTGMDARTVQQIKRSVRDPREQMANALILCRERKIIPSAGALCNRLIASGFEQTALTLLDVSQSQYHCTTLTLDDVEEENE